MVRCSCNSVRHFIIKIIIPRYFTLRGVSNQIAYIFPRGIPFRLRNDSSRNAESARRSLDEMIVTRGSTEAMEFQSPMPIVLAHIKQVYAQLAHNNNAKGRDGSASLREEKGAANYGNMHATGYALIDVIIFSLRRNALASCVRTRTPTDRKRGYKVRVSHITTEVRV